MRGDEIETFLKSLDAYKKHLLKNQQSILSRIYGVYTIQMSHLKPVNIILMQNTMCINEEDEL